MSQWLTQTLDFAHVVQAGDVRMIECCHRAGFAFEPLSPGGIGGEMLPQHLDGDGPIQPGVERAIDFAHPAGPDQLNDLVGAKANTRRERHSEPLKVEGLYGGRCSKIALGTEWL